MKPKIILGIDPGYGIVGFGIVKVEKNKVSHICHGVIKTLAKSSFADRLTTIANDLEEIIKSYPITHSAVEKLYFTNNQKTAIDVGQARGVILLTLNKFNLPIVELTPLQVKQGITSYGQADKIQIQKMIKAILNLDKIPKPDDAADALAIAITGSQY